LNGEIIKGVIASMTLENNFWGYLFSRIKKQPDKNLGALMGVAYDKEDRQFILYYDPCLEEEYKENTLLIMKLLEHEGIHILYRHHSRINRMWNIQNNIIKMNTELFQNLSNIAADLAVNSLINMPDFPGIFHPYLPSQYNFPEKQTYEFYYEKLIKMPNKYFDKPVPQHNWTIDEDPDIQQKMNYVTYKLIKDIRKTMRGKLPGNLEEIVNDILEPPKLPYYQLIKKIVKGSRLSRYKRDAKKMNKKRIFAFMEKFPEIIPFPGRVRDKTFNVGILIDTSGSRSIDDIKEDLSAIKSIIENDHNCIVTAIQIDTEIREERRIKNINELKEFKIHGRGGTKLYPALRRFKELEKDIVIAFTDGYIDNLNNVNKNKLPKILWVIPEDGTTLYLGDTGMIIYIKRKSKK